MKFTIARSALLEPLQRVANVVERRHTIPILANVLIEVSESSLSLKGSDQEVELSSHINIEGCEVPGEITVPARKFTDICRSIREGSQLAISLDENRLQIQSGKFKSHLATLPVMDFPAVEMAKGEVTFELDSRSLLGVLEKTSFAMAQQDVRYFFNGLLLETSDTGVRAVATNGQRLAISDLPSGELGSHQYIIPRKGVQELMRILPDDDSVPAQLSFSANHMQVECANTALISKLIDATYPDYGRAIPEGGDKVVKAHREELQEALTRTAILSNEMYKNVRLVLSSGNLELHTNNPMQEEAEEIVAVDYEGGSLEIGFNINYLIEALNVMGGEYVQLLFSDSNSACLLTDPDDIKSRYVISPMML